MSSEDTNDNRASDERPSQEINFRLDQSPAVSGRVEIPSYDEVSLEPDTSKKNIKIERILEMDFRKYVNSHPSNAYATHRIHKHPAVFIPHIPRHIIETYTTEKNEDGQRPLILDPFSGSGTTGLEAKLLGRNYIGIELNPFSKLVSKVKTSPIPPSLVHEAKKDLNSILNNVDGKYYSEYDVEFLDTTNKNLWFEDSAIRELTQIRKCIDEFDAFSYDVQSVDSEHESRIIRDIGKEELQIRLQRWFVLMIANTVFEVSNADPGVSKAYKSPKMKEKIKTGEHPPNAIRVFISELEESSDMLKEYWNMIYEHQYEKSQAEGEPDSLENNHAHKACIDIRVGDAREFTDPDYYNSVDLAITSPPYINAMNYYRGTKLRLFWIHDLIDEIVDPDVLRKSIVGTNSVSIKGLDDLPKKTIDQWNGTIEGFQNTSLPQLDQTIIEIHTGGLTEAKRRAYTTWKFFNIDMVKSLGKTYKHLKPGAHFFLVIGENTIGGNKIQSHRYIADIAKNIGKFDNSTVDSDDSYRFVGFAWDEISNRELFQSRNHTNGVIEGEWIVMLQKPR